MKGIHLLAKSRALDRDEEPIAEILWIAVGKGRGSVRSVTNQVAIRPVPFEVSFSLDNSYRNRVVSITYL